MARKRDYCDFCKSKDLLLLFSNVEDYESNLKNKVNLLQCHNCNLVQQSNIYSLSEIELFYSKNYHGRNYKTKTLLNKLSNFLRKSYYKRFINILEKKNFSKNIKILDYGSGDGFLANELKLKGFKNIYCCDFFEPNLAKNDIDYFLPDNIKNYKHTFDVVFMLNSIEHLQSFSNDFKNISSSMREKGLLILETPNLNSLDSSIFKKYWGGLHQPRHTFLWSKKSLINHLNQMGFSVKILGSPQSAHWAISIQNICTNYIKFCKRFINKGRMPGYVLLVLLFLPISILQNFFGKESVINLYAVITKK